MNGPEAQSRSKAGQNAVMRYLRVEEASHPVGLRPAGVEPFEELVMALQQAQEPITKRAGLP